MKINRFFQSLQQGTLLFICFLTGLFGKRYLLLLLVFAFVESNAQTRVVHYSTKCSVFNAGGQYTSVTTAQNGDLYSAWMDENRNLKVSKITISPSTNQVEVIRTNMQEDKYHVRPSIVLDRLGYVHVAADMHNQNWVYYRSLNPYDITPANFQMITPPGYLIGYPNFFKDKNDDLYITFRHKVKPAPNQFSVGSSGGGIIRYNATTKVFTMLGGTNHGLDKTVVWVNMGGAGTSSGGTTIPGHYQQPNIRLFFDNSNKMHLICNLINQPTTGASDANTHVLYAYSMDSGQTFKRVDGSSITSLPMGPNAGPSSMTVVASRTQADILADCYIGAFDTNKPVVSWRSAGDGSKIAYWNGTAWQFITPGGSSAGRMLFSRRTGETLFFVPVFNYLHRTFDGGSSFQRYDFTPSYSNGASQPTQSEVVDADYYIKKGNVRYQYSNRTTEDSIYLSTIPFTPMIPNSVPGMQIMDSSKIRDNVHLVDLKDKFVVYPNPLQEGNLTIRSTLPVSGQTYQIQVFNAVGGLVYNNTATVNGTAVFEHRINSQYFSKGNYSICLFASGKKVFTTKLVVK